MEVLNINGTSRATTGKKANKALRREGLVPCVIYGGKEVVHFSSKSKSFKELIYTADFKLAEIAVDGKTYKCTLKDMQFHPVTDEVIHLDFVELVDKQRVTLEVPLRFTGSAPGVKVGGKLMTLLRRVKIKVAPENMVDHLNVSIEELNLGQSVRIRDIEVPDGVEILNAPALPVGAVEVPRALRSAEAEAEATEGDEGADAAETTEAAAE